MNKLLWYLEQADKETPDRVAFCDGNCEMTYAELRQKAQRLARRLDGPKDVQGCVVIIVRTGISSIVSIFGTMYSGNYFCILSPDLPSEYIKNILSDCNPAFIVTDQDSFQKVNGISVGEYLIIQYEEGISDDANVSEAIYAGRGKGNTCLLMFTSGSTGKPKGVLISLDAVTSSVEGNSDYFQLKANSKIGIQFPLYSIAGLAFMLLAVKEKGSTLLIEMKNMLSLEKHAELVRKYSVSNLFITTAYLMLVYECGLVSKYFANVSDVLFGGEVAPFEKLSDIVKSNQHITFYNGYGATETMGGCIYHSFRRKLATANPIGKTMKGAEALVLNNNDELTSCGEQGELCIRGNVLADGYLNDPEQTKMRFVQNPIVQEHPDIIYRTGDLVIWNENDDLVYKGRKDHQIQHNGHRVELGEIENIISSIEDISECACIYDSNRRTIVLLYCGVITEMEVSRIAREKMPAYMVPGGVIRIDHIPHNMNGKIDRVEIEKIYTERCI